MDLAIGAKKTYVMMEYLTKGGEAKLVEACSYPLTGVHCVARIYSDLAVIDLAGGQASVIDIVDGLDFDALQALTKVPLHNAL
jgi:3-oxoadipate CoA-transferase beta subunit